MNEPLYFIFLSLWIPIGPYVDWVCPFFQHDVVVYVSRWWQSIWKVKHFFILLNQWCQKFWYSFLPLYLIQFRYYSQVIKLPKNPCFSLRNVFIIAFKVIPDLPKDASPINTTVSIPILNDIRCSFQFAVIVPRFSNH